MLIQPKNITMNISELKAQWQASFDKSIASIEDYLQSKPDDYPEKQDFRILANWIVENQQTGYSYMPSGFESSISNPLELEGFLCILLHALCDDGGISFVTMKLEDEPLRVFMLFIDSNEDYFRTICEKDNTSLMDGFINSRKLMNKFTQKLKSESPERNLSLKPTISKEDFVFEAHRDPIVFIKELEAFQTAKAEKHKKIDEHMAEIRKKKM